MKNCYNKEELEKRFYGLRIATLSKGKGITM